MKTVPTARELRSRDGRGVSPYTNLRGQTALITGASRGIGAALARSLAAQGCNLILTSRDEKTLAKIGREVSRKGIRVVVKACDVRDPNSVNDLFRTVRGRFRRIDILINNSGVAHPNLPVEKLSFSIWKDVLATNLDGIFLVTQAALPLIRRGGTIVNNLSIAATRVFAGSAAYNASKHAALGLTNTLREELRSKGVRVIGLFPGATDTEIWNTLWPQAPRKKMLSPQTVAEAVINALVLPSNATVETLEILPSIGTL
jgi:NAD(P)-dependent dehydrogenase (short-subunit alcohol dehydrogenase family)